ncbi:MAG: hypothetical protein WD669_03550 [Pirellulales bacterium]
MLMLIHRALRVGLPSMAALLVAWMVIATPACGQMSAARLQSLANDSVAQLQLSYRHDSVERSRRYDELGQAIAAWNKSARSAADNERLAEWLRQAMRASMPGSREALPPLPEFPRPAPTAEETPLPPRPPSSMTGNKLPTASTPSPAAEPTPADPLPHENTPARAEQAAGEPVVEKVEKSDALPGTLTSKPVTAETPVDQAEGDPFRDDPLPVDK